MEERISIREAVERGVSVLRRDPWAPWGRITLQLSEGADGKRYVGPWIVVEDGATEFCDLAPQTLLLMHMVPDMDAREWEPWVRPEEA